MITWLSIVLGLGGCSDGSDDSVEDDSGGDDSGSPDDSDVADDSGEDDSGTPPTDDGTDVALVGDLEEVAVEIFEDPNGSNGGSTLALLHDVSGDGLPDAMVGAPAEIQGAKSGVFPRAYIVAGGSYEGGEALEALTEIVSEETFDMGGLVFGSPGDLDGDGLAEVLYTRPFSSTDDPG